LETKEVIGEINELKKKKFITSFLGRRPKDKVLMGGERRLKEAS